MFRGTWLFGLIAIAGSLLLWCSPTASLAEWSAVADANVFYTDNVFELSAARRLALTEDPSQPSIVPTNRPSDVVWQPSVDLRHRSTSGIGLTDLSFKAQGFLFTNNPIFDHGDYRLQLHQQVAPNTFVLLRYRYVPNLFLGPNVERQTGQRLPEEERVTSHTWRMQVERQVSDRWMMTLVGRYGLRFYNDAFSERDTAFYTIGPRVQFAAARWAILTLDYLYERGVSDGRDEPQFKDDVSYRQHFVSVGTLWQLTAPLSLELIYVYRHKQFTTDIAGDPLLGNTDQVHQGTAELHYLLSPVARVTLGFQRTQRTSSASARDFFNTNTSLGLRYLF